MLLEILRECEKYLTGKLSARELEDFVVSNRQSVMDRGDREELGLLNELNGVLMEWVEGSIPSESTVKEKVETAMARVNTTRVLAWMFVNQSSTNQDFTVTSASSNESDAPNETPTFSDDSQQIPKLKFTMVEGYR